MGLLDWLFGTAEKKKETRKRVFISFAIEDVQYRDYLVDQARKKHSPFDFIDMSVKKNGTKTNGKIDAERKLNDVTE